MRQGLLRQVLLGTAAMAAVAAVGVLPAAANTVTGTIYETTTTNARNATTASVASAISASAPTVTFTAPSPLNFNPTDTSAIYHIGTWLASGGGVVTGGTGNPLDSMDGTLLEIKGTVSVTTGETFTASHDDGVTFTIGTDLVINSPGPRSVINSTGTYTGAPGNEAFTLVYGECCGPPATLAINLPLSSPVPEPGSLALLGTALAGLGLVFGLRRRKVA